MLKKDIGALTLVRAVYISIIPMRRKIQLCSRRHCASYWIDHLRLKGESFYFTANKQHYIGIRKSGATLLWISHHQLQTTIGKVLMTDNKLINRNITVYNDILCLIIEPIYPENDSDTVGAFKGGKTQLRIIGGFKV